MTEPGAGRRRFRGGPSAEHVPEQLAAWFRDEIQDTWYRLLPNEVELLGLCWQSYKAEHPDAIPPSDYAWLDDPSDPPHPSEAEVREARRMLSRDR